MPVALPPPLKAEEEQLYIEKWMNGDVEAKNVLIERNTRLVMYMVRKFSNTEIDPEDLYSIGVIGLIKAVNTYKTGKDTKLATYASMCINNEILMTLRKQKGQNNLSLDAPLNLDADGNELMLSDILGHEDTIIEKRDDFRTLHKAINLLSPRERDIITSRYGFLKGDEINQRECAGMLNISQSYVSRLEVKILAKLKKIIDGMNGTKTVQMIHKQKRVVKKVQEEKIEKLTRETAAELLKTMTAAELAEKYAPLYSNQKRVVSAMLAKWDLVGKKKVVPESAIPGEDPVIPVPAETVPTRVSKLKPRLLVSEETQFEYIISSEVITIINPQSSVIEIPVKQLKTITAELQEVLSLIEA